METKPTLHCHNCGWVYTLDGQPGRSESCHQCGQDLRVCLNCVHHAYGVAHECRERRAEPVAQKDQANFCEFFEFKRRVWTGRKGDDRESAARDQLNKLFGE